MDLPTTNPTIESCFNPDEERCSGPVEFDNVLEGHGTERQERSGTCSECKHPHTATVEVIAGGWQISGQVRF